MRFKTFTAKVPLLGGIAPLAAAMQPLLHARIAFRLPIIMAGALFNLSRQERLPNHLRCPC
jgi:hypothetical protein